ncbi:MAG: DUF255 domain-containing protein [Nanoarchaeota archaeon]|nr:DUF255 domain-containing protein [Nanoarchaeota archaeon]
MRNKIGFMFVLLVFSIALVQASEEYSFENSERLKPLIEWRDYGDLAFEEAQEQGKPVFLLLTAPSWCYWCQVYESTDYLFNPSVVEIINSKFIPIYVNADERQDLTRQYLEGGWPSSTIMTPLGDRIYGFSGVRPVPDMIRNLNDAVIYVASLNLVSEFSYEYQEKNIYEPFEAELNSMVNSYVNYNLNQIDSEYGGFGIGQKFPQALTLDHFLDIYEKTGSGELLNAVKLTLENQYTRLDEIKTNYNLFDPVEGGFHRYGVSRDWSPPHYEKMLYDNARLLRLYRHLLEIEPNNSLALEIISKTEEYIELNWYDSDFGGFYGNTDVNGEEAYYGLVDRGDVKARVEKTKFTDWNSEMILTYLYLYEISGDEKYKDMSKKSLDFFAKNMIGEFGAYHYFNIKGEKGVRGSLLDNSYLMLAFVRGYEVFREVEYLDAAKKLAVYQQNNLYDWNSGGFFERNSPDLELYALGDNVLLNKPASENGVAAFAFLKLYGYTNEQSHLLMGYRTIGNQIEGTPGMDRGYYMIQAIEEFNENNYYLVYLEIEDELRIIEEEGKANFWLTSLLEQKFDFSYSSTKVEGPLLFLIFISLFAGFLSFISPCTLPILPAFVAYSLKSSHKNLRGMTVSFFSGLILVFALLGMVATFVGAFLKNNLTVFSEFSGLVIIFVGIYILSGRGIPNFRIHNKVPNDYLGAFFFGMILAIAWTPCVGPILVAILIIASTTTSYLTGGLLLASYGFGLSLPLIYVSTYLGKRKGKGKFWNFIRGRELVFELSEEYKFRIHSSTLISGLLFIILGYLIFSGKLFIFNQYLGGTKFQGFVFGIEEWLPGFFD